MIQRPYRYGYQTEYVSWCLGRRELLAALDGLCLQLVREFVVGFKPPVAHAPQRPEYRGYLLEVHGDAASSDEIGPGT